MNTNTKSISDFLLNLGLTKLEAQIYLILLEYGRCSVTDLAHKLNMNRVTLHFNLERIIEMGIVSHVKQGRMKELSAQPPEILEDIIVQKDNQMKLLKQQFQTVLPDLNQIIHSQSVTEQTFDVRYFHGLSGVRAIYKEVLDSKEIRSYVNIAAISSFIPENPSLFPNESHQKNIDMWEIIEDSPQTRSYLKTVDPVRYHYKFFPPSANIISLYDFMIFEGKIAMISGKDEINGIVVTNESMFINTKTIFELMWNLLPKPQIKK
jgi:sugar-specific transcriptional regulator TrmB